MATSKKVAPVQISRGVPILAMSAFVFILFLPCEACRQCDKSMSLFLMDNHWHKTYYQGSFPEVFLVDLLGAVVQPGILLGIFSFSFILLSEALSMKGSSRHAAVILNMLTGPGEGGIAHGLLFLLKLTCFLLLSCSNILRNKK